MASVLNLEHPSPHTVTSKSQCFVLVLVLALIVALAPPALSEVADWTEGQVPITHIQEQTGFTTNTPPSPSNWTPTAQPNLASELALAPELQTVDAAPAPKRVMTAGKPYLVPNPDSVGWDMIMPYFSEYRGSGEVVIHDFETGVTSKQVWGNNTGDVITTNGFDFHMKPSFYVDKKLVFTQWASGPELDNLAVMFSMYDPGVNRFTDWAIPDPEGPARNLIGGSFAMTDTGMVYGIAWDEFRNGYLPCSFNPTTAQAQVYPKIGNYPTDQSFSVNYVDAAAVSEPGGDHIYVEIGSNPWRLVTYNFTNQQGKVLAETAETGNKDSIKTAKIEGGVRGTIKDARWIDGIGACNYASFDFWLRDGQIIPRTTDTPPWSTEPFVRTPSPLFPWQNPNQKWPNGYMPPANPPLFEDDSGAPYDPDGNVTLNYQWNANGPNAALEYSVLLYEGRVRRVREINNRVLFATDAGYGQHLFYDLDSETVQRTYVRTSPYSTGISGNSLFVSAYPNSRLWEYKLFEPVENLGNGSSTNPSSPGYLGDWNDTHCPLAGTIGGADGTVYSAGTTYGRNRDGGGLGWWDPATGDPGGIILNDSVYWMTHTNDRRYLILSNQPGVGTYKQLYCWDTKNKGFVWQESYTEFDRGGPVIEALPGGLVMGYGSLGTNKGVLYGLKVATGEVLWTKEVPVPPTLSLGGVREHAYIFRRGPGGYVWANIGSTLVKIDPINAQIYPIGQLPDGPAQIAFANGSIYTAGNGDLKRIVGATAGDNQGPQVDAGTADSIVLPVDTCSLSGTVTDDGYPMGGSLTHAWSQQSGPGTVTFANPNALNTTATFTMAGTYILRLTASDTDMTAYNQVTVIVHPVGTNVAPTVNAGTNLSLRWPSNRVSLTGTIIDDPYPVGVPMTQMWSVIGGPGTVEFSDPNAVVTTATFSTFGTYVLRLTADDTELTAYDEITVTALNPLLKIPTTGLTLHLDGANSNNSSDTWVDSSVSANHATMTGTAFTPGLGYTFPVENTDVGRFTPIQPQTADKFAFAVRFTSGTNRTGQQALLASSNAAWNLFCLDYSNGAVSWRAHNSGTLFRNEHFINPDNLTGENMVGVSWETTSGAGGLTGTARIYLNGVCQGEVSGVDRPTTDYPAHSALDRIGRRGASDNPFDGDISQVVIYMDYADSSHALMDALYHGINTAPTVNAGVDATITLPEVATLNATVIDDSLPIPTSLSVMWSVASGPAPVIFGNPNAVDTTATFTTAGTYVLRLTADDTALTAENTVTITVNEAPVINPFDKIPTTGLILYLKEANSSNSSGTWVDSSISANDVTMTGTGFIPGVGYTFSAGNTDVGKFTPIQPQTADKFAFAVRFTPGTNRTGQQALLGSANAAWNLFYLDYSNGSVTWTAYNSGIVFRNEHFIDPYALTGENMVGVSWETTSGPGGLTGTARIYLNGVFKGEVTGVGRPTTDYPAHSAFDRIGRRGASDNPFHGSISQVVIYMDYAGSSDALMDNVYNGIAVWNAPPTVNAGIDATITLPEVATLNATVTDDGLRLSPSSTVMWSVDSGPAPVTFSNPNAIDTTATFTTAGIYDLRLTVDDTALAGGDTVRITVNEAVVLNQFYEIPTTGLVLHLDGENSGNSSDIWVDSSTSANHATMTGTAFTPGLEYAFPTGKADVGRFTPIQPQTADKFAFAVRFTPGTNRTGQQALLASSNAAWNLFYLDYSNESVTWSASPGRPPAVLAV